MNFTILLVLLKKFLYKPILKVLEERKTKIAQSLKSAEEIEKRLAEASSEQEKIIKTAHDAATALITETKKESKELAEKMLAETKTSIAEMLKTNQERLSLEKDQMLKEVKSDLADIVIAATSRVTKGTVDAEGNRKLVEDTLKEVAK